MAGSRGLSYLLLVAMLLVAAVSASEYIEDPKDAQFNRLMEWVQEEGGYAHVSIGEDEDGLRGLYATRDLDVGGVIMFIPASRIINLGGFDEFGVPPLMLLRELYSPCSRFQPYLAMLPGPGEVFNGCNMPESYIPMMQSQFWEQKLKSWHYALAHIMTPAAAQSLEILVEEAVGHSNVTLVELQQACALATTRYISGDPRMRLLMVPVFDLLNHRTGCEHFVSAYESTPLGFWVRAGVEVKKGQELCYDYGDLRDDYALVHYGFIQKLRPGAAGEDPAPELSLVDHYEFPGHLNVSLDGKLFDGSRAELVAARKHTAEVLAALEELDQTEQPPPVIPGTERLHAALLSYQQRRRQALRAEVVRIDRLLEERDGHQPADREGPAAGQQQSGEL